MKAVNKGANLDWAAFASVFHILALFSTMLRLVHRLRTSRMWWDDYMVVLPLGMDIIYFANLWCKFQCNGGGEIPPARGISSYWVSQFLFLSINWSCRISIALSLARVFPAFHKARRSAFFLAAICVLSYLCCLLVITFLCPSTNAPWYKTVATDCHKTGTFVGGEVAAALDVFVDLSLILFPIITLWKVKLPQNLRRIIIWAFTGSALTLITAINFCIVRYINLDLEPSQATVVILSSHLEAAIFYRIFRRVHDLEGSDPPIARQVPSQDTEGRGAIGSARARETSIGQVSVLDTEDRPLSFTLTRISELVWSSVRISEPPTLFSHTSSG